MRTPADSTGGGGNSLPTSLTHERAVPAVLSCPVDGVAVRDVVRDLVLDVCSSMMDYEPVQGAPGACIGCGVADAAFSQCLSCGAPVEPTDGSWHFAFGWVEGARPDM